jgi:hypothetical protein
VCIDRGTGRTATGREEHDIARQVVTHMVNATKGRISAKRLLPIGRAADTRVTAKLPAVVR